MAMPAVALMDREELVEVGVGNVEVGRIMVVDDFSEVVVESVDGVGTVVVLSEEEQKEEEEEEEKEDKTEEDETDAA